MFTPYSLVANPHFVTVMEENTAHLDNWKYVHFEDYRSAIRQHLSTVDEQGKRCFYCNKKMSRDDGANHIEHILDKSQYPQFTYEPRNLILACKGCNFSKKTDDVSPTIDFNVQDYPFNSNSFIIVHPYLDEYTNHIEVIEELFFLPFENSDKGKATIRICKLDRFSLLEEKAEAIHNGEDELRNCLNDLRIARNNETIEESITHLLAIIGNLDFNP